MIYIERSGIIKTVKAFENLQQREGSVMKMHNEKLHEVERPTDGPDDGLQEVSYTERVPKKWKSGVSDKALERVLAEHYEHEKRERGVH